MHGSHQRSIMPTPIPISHHTNYTRTILYAKAKQPNHKNTSHTKPSRTGNQRHTTYTRLATIKYIYKYEYRTLIIEISEHQNIKHTISGHQLHIKQKNKMVAALYSPPTVYIIPPLRLSALSICSSIM